jgi:ribosomal protein L5
MSRTNLHITNKIRMWHKMTMERYALVCNLPQESLSTPYLNHPINWSCQSKIVLHVASEKILHNWVYYGSLMLGFACIGGQTLSMIKSKQSLTGFNLIKGSLMGGSCVLRRQNLLQLQYKLCWLAPCVQPLPHLFSSSSLLSSTAKESKKETVGDAMKLKVFNKPSLGVKFFLFPELDLLDYDSFEALKGFELTFAKKSKQ